jgi:hypothetical protein
VFVFSRYERFTPLVVEEGGLPGGYADVRAGDCIVAFSRREIFDIKQVGQPCACPSLNWTEHYLSCFARTIGHP